MSENGTKKESNHDKFKEFWEKYAKFWRRGLQGNYPAPAAMAFHNAIKGGAGPDEILRGARIYDETVIPTIDP